MKKINYISTLFTLDFLAVAVNMPAQNLYIEKKDASATEEFKISDIDNIVFVPESSVNENVNVVYIMTDEQSHYMISEISKNLTGQYANNPYFSTPNLDKLIKKGYAFANAYCGNAVSVPSRFALLTGESPNKYGNTGNVTTSKTTSPGRTQMQSVIQTRSMGQLFKKAGYETVYGGKVHLPFSGGGNNVSQEPTYYGFDTYLTWNDRDILAQKGVEFLNTYNGSKPFLLFLSFMNPHDICMAQLLWSTTQTSLDDFPSADRDELLARANQLYWQGIYKAMPPSSWNEGTLAKLPDNYASTSNNFPINNLSSVNSSYSNDARKRASIWFYYRLMEQVDAEIGQVLTALENSPFKDNTVIIFTSDHGDMGISHNLTAKNLPYQECQKVPLIFVGNGVPQGVIDTESLVCSGWDLLPTMLDLMGLPIPNELNGQGGISLLDKMTKNTPITRQYVYTETVNSCVVLDGTYKYIRFFPTFPGGGDSPYTLATGQTEALFNLQTDPGELNNLAGNSSYNTIKETLKTVLQAEVNKRGIANVTI